MRCDQFMGLNRWALDFVRGEQVFVCMEEVTRVYIDGRRETIGARPVFKPSVKMKWSGRFYSGMFDDEYALQKYIFPDGRVYFEEVQAKPFSSGPVFFLTLQDENGNWVPESLWAEDTIAAA